MAVLSLAATALCLTLATSAQAARNLLANPSAEAGPGSLDGTAAPSPVPSWTLSGSFAVVSYGATVQGYAITPSPSFASSIGAGSNLFAGGASSTDSSASQTVDLSSQRRAIRRGHAVLTLGAYLGGWGAQNDRMQITAYELGPNNTTLGSIRIGPVTASDRLDRTTVSYRSTHHRVPRNTREVKLVMRAIRASGTFNNALADELSLTLRSA